MKEYDRFQMQSSICNVKQKRRHIGNSNKTIHGGRDANYFRLATEFNPKIKITNFSSLVFV